MEIKKCLTCDTEVTIKRPNHSGKCKPCNQREHNKRYKSTEKGKAAIKRAVQKHIVKDSPGYKKVLANTRRYNKTPKGIASNFVSQNTFRAKKAGTYIELTPEELEQVRMISFMIQALEEITGDKYEADHILPIASGGTNHPDNLQILTQEEHRIKTGKENAERTGRKAIYSII